MRKTKLQVAISANPELLNPSFAPKAANAPKKVRVMNVREIVIAIPIAKVT